MSKQKGVEKSANRLLFRDITWFHLDWSYEQVKNACIEIRPEGKYWCDCHLFFEEIHKLALEMEPVPVPITRKTFEVYTKELYFLSYDKREEEICKRISEAGYNLDEGDNMETVIHFIAHKTGIIEAGFRTGKRFKNDQK